MGEESQNDEVGGIRIKSKVKYLGMTLSSRRQEMKQEAILSIRRNIMAIKGKVKMAQSQEVAPNIFRNTPGGWRYMERLQYRKG